MKLRKNIKLFDCFSSSFTYNFFMQTILTMTIAQMVYATDRTSMLNIGIDAPDEVYRPSVSIVGVEVVELYMNNFSNQKKQPMM